MKLLVINATFNTGSAGRIAEGIRQKAEDSSIQTWYGYGRSSFERTPGIIRIGTDKDIIMHGFNSRIFDNHGFSSTKATEKFILEIDKIKPDVINIHNLHGYYINVKVLFGYLNTISIPIVWTLHDCWPFTGHCSYFDRYKCLKWQTQCYDCPNTRGYPESWFLDRSKVNFQKKRKLFTENMNIHFVAPSEWMAGLLRKSFFSDFPVKVINNGIDLNVFKPLHDGSIHEKYNIRDSKIILGVANTWDRRKGLDDFVKLSSLITKEYRIILVGLSKRQIAALPGNIIGITRTESRQELAALYSTAEVFVNPTYIDNFPTTNIEALACGTPVITYDTGGSAEAIDQVTGIVNSKGDVDGLLDGIRTIAGKGKFNFSEACRSRAVKLYSKEDRFQDYIKIFQSVLKD